MMCSTVMNPDYRSLHSYPRVQRSMDHAIKEDHLKKITRNNTNNTLLIEFFRSLCSQELHLS